MKYDHMVKVNGLYYAAGMEVPCDTETKEPAGEETGQKKSRRGRKPADTVRS